MLAVREIGPWTVQCLGLFGRGDPDSLPAGDLIYLKLVGRLARLGRRATVEEVEEFYAPYAPFRGLAAAWTTGVIDPVTRIRSVWSSTTRSLTPARSAKAPAGTASAKRSSTW